MNELKSRTVWDLYNYVESLYPNELAEIRMKKIVFVEDLISVLQNKIDRCSKEIQDNEAKLQQTSEPETTTLIKAQIAILDTGSNAYRAIIRMLSDSCNKTEMKTNE
jgi:hypothetical protein